MQTATHDIAIEASRGAPAVAGALAASLTLNEWVAIATGTYILIQCLYLLRKWWREEKDWSHTEERRHHEVEGAHHEGAGHE